MARRGQLQRGNRGPYWRALSSAPLTIRPEGRLKRKAPETVRRLFIVCQLVKAGSVAHGLDRIRSYRTGIIAPTLAQECGEGCNILIAQALGKTGHLQLFRAFCR
ncbi:hypothetical protein SAMN04488056_10146 [Cohaesibacter marisflavi]|uniref:Uncharacterized protein n=1 Tax=Cohaesibacter marisflavi TaxID=655353 RepID=A0A1I4ZCV3_9HYPH|nr:hypothetical protein SAMN04488056_10146 [Cohaesibacter marisflavi]